MNPKEQFCPNPKCTDCGVTGKKNIGIHSKKQRRYICHKCKKTFSQTKGTMMYRKHHEHKFISQVICLLAHNCPIQAIVAAFGLDERTVSQWQKQAGLHCKKFHESFVEPKELVQVQTDEICVNTQSRKIWIAMAIAVMSRFWLGCAISKRRDMSLIKEIAEKVKRWSLCRPMLLVFDGFAAYIKAFRDVYRTAVLTGKKGRPHLVSWPFIHLGQVVKQYAKGRCVGVIRKIVRGTNESVNNLIKLSQKKGVLNTSYIERLNATFRASATAFVRRTRALVRKAETLEPVMYLVGCVYNFCSTHQSLRKKLYIKEHQYRWVKITPAMAHGLTDHPWSVFELLCYKIPPSPYVQPKRRGRPKKVFISIS